MNAELQCALWHQRLALAESAQRQPRNARIGKIVVKTGDYFG
jgi:hypothetical protein